MTAREVLTARVRIRDWTLEDHEALAEIFAKPEVWQYPFGRGLDAEETRAYIERKIEEQRAGTGSPSALEERATGRLLGYVALGPPWWLPEVMPAVEIGWRLDPPYWGRGLVTEGAEALLAYGFLDMGLEEILSIYEPDNVASGRVMERIGMPFDRVTTHPYFERTLHIHRLTRTAWEQARRA